MTVKDISDRFDDLGRLRASWVQSGIMGLDFERYQAAQLELQRDLAMDQQAKLAAIYQGLMAVSQALARDRADVVLQ